jgi:hypothetical protein
VSVVPFLSRNPPYCAGAHTWCDFVADVAEGLSALLFNVAHNKSLLRAREDGWASTTRSIGGRARVLEFFPDLLGHPSIYAVIAGRTADVAMGLYCPNELILPGRVQLAIVSMSRHMVVVGG